MENQTPKIKVTIQIIEGSRSKPLMGLSSGNYRPHIVIGDPKQRQVKMKSGTNEGTEHYLGVQFVSGPDIAPFDTDFEAQMRLTYFPNVDYSEALPGNTFTLREGSKIIGFGRIIDREG